LGYTPAATPDFGLSKAFGPAPRAHQTTDNAARTVAFVHGTSRADKEWPLAHWLALGRRFNAAGWQVALAHGSAREQATSQALADALNEGTPGQAIVWPLQPLDTLTCALARCGGVIGVDSGVSHIAVALDLPHVQLYNFDTAWRTGPDEAGGHQASVFAQPAPGVEAVWQAWLACQAAAAGAKAAAA
jgi:heptosyltransferase-1